MSSAAERGVLGKPDRPAQVGDGERQVAAETAAQPGADRPRQGLARRAMERGVEGVDQPGPSGDGRLLDQEPVGRRGPRCIAPGPRTARRSPRRRSGPGRARAASRSRAAAARPRPAAGPPRRGSAASSTRQLGRQRLAVAGPSRQVRLAAAGPGVDDPRLQPAELQRAAVEHEAVAGRQPLGVRRFERADRHAVLQHPHRLLRVRSSRRCSGTSGPPGRCGCRTSRPVARSAARSSAARRPARARTHPPVPPGRPRGTPGRRRNRPASARPSGRPCGSARNAASTDCSPAQAMPTICWQTTSSGAAIDRKRLDPAGPGGSRRDRRAGQLGGRRRQQQPARRRPPAMARPADPLDAPRHAARQADLDGQVGRADVNAQLQAGARHDGADLARLQPRLDRPPPLGIEGRMVRGDDRVSGSGWEAARTMPARRTRLRTSPP